MNSKRKTIYTKVDLVFDKRYPDRPKCLVHKYVPRANTEYIHFGMDRYTYDSYKQEWIITAYHVFDVGKPTLALKGETIIAKDEALRYIALEELSV